MFAVVEHHQHAAIADEPHQHIHGLLTGLIGQVKRARRCHGHRVGICDRRQVDIPNAVGELGGYVGGDLYCQTRLAAPPGRSV